MSDAMKCITPAIVTANLDIYRTANLLIQQHGEDAAIQAAMKADEMLEKGDLDGKAVWMQVVRAIEKLQATKPEGALH